VEGRLSDDIIFIVVFYITLELYHKLLFCYNEINNPYLVRLPSFFNVVGSNDHSGPLCINQITQVVPYAVNIKINY